MRVLHVISGLCPGGAEVFVRDLTLQMSTMSGCESAVAYFSRAADLGLSEAFEAEYLAALRQANIPAHLLGHSTRRNPIAAAFRLRRVLRTFRADVLHVHLARGMLARAFLPSRIRTLYTHHSVRIHFDARLFRLFDLLTARYVAICETAARALAGVVRQPIVTIFNGIAPERIHCAGVRQGHAPLQIVSVGNLRREKDYLSLVKIAVALRRRLRPGTQMPRFSIAGEGEERRAIEAAIVRDGLESHVRLLGNRADIDLLMAKADLLLQTSAWEGFPIVLLEATRSGLPIVAADVGGVGEIVSHGQNGFLVDRSSPESLVEETAGLLLRLMVEPDLLSSLSTAACALSERFSIGEAAERHRELYETLLA